MKSFLGILAGISLMVSISTQVFSQKTCKDYVQNNCEPFGKPFRYSGQSKDGLFELGQKSLFKITVYDGFEYRVSLCAEKNMKGIFFRLREDDINKTILYDSSVEEDDFLEKLFYVNTSKNLFIEVVVPESDIPLETQSYQKRFGCVGVLIEYNKRGETGIE